MCYFTAALAPDEPAGLNIEFLLGGTGNGLIAPSLPNGLGVANLAAYYSESKDQWLFWWGDVAAVKADLAQGKATIRVKSDATFDSMVATHAPFTLCLAEFMKRVERYFLHAGCVSMDGRAVLIPARSGEGKTTLTLTLVRAGFDFLSDDVVFLRRTGDVPEVLAFPDEVDVTDTTASFFPELHRFIGTHKPGWAKQQFQVPEVYGKTPVDSSTPTLILLPHAAPELPHCVLEPVNTSEAFEAVDGNVIPTEATSTEAHHKAMEELVRSCECYRIRMGADWIEKAPELIRNALLSA